MGLTPAERRNEKHSPLEEPAMYNKRHQESSKFRQASGAVMKTGQNHAKMPEI